MSPYERGQFVAASSGIVNGNIYRIHFKFEPENPDGYYLKGRTAFEAPLKKTIFPPERIPVKVVFVEAPKVASDGEVGLDGRVVYKQSETLPIDAVPSMWEGEFEPTEDYVPPLA